MRKIFSEAIVYFVAIALCLVISTWIFHLWELDWSVPSTYTGDGLGYSAGFKGIIDNGWFFENPYLGMPTGQQI